MAKKALLNENVTRRMLKLANINPISTENFLTEAFKGKDEDMMEEEGMASSVKDEAYSMDEGDDALYEEMSSMTQEEKLDVVKSVMDALADTLDLGEVDVEMAGEEEMADDVELDDEMPVDDEMADDVEGGTDELSASEEDAEVEDDTGAVEDEEQMLDENLVETIVDRLHKRIVNESKKKDQKRRLAESVADRVLKRIKA